MDADDTATTGDSTRSDVAFHFDPVCPFAWMTSKWIRMVAEQRQLRVDWRFIALRLVNADVDYATHFPAGYEAGHTLGLRLLRVAARVRADHGNDAVGRLYAAYGADIFDRYRGRQQEIQVDTAVFVTSVLDQLGLPADLVDALDDTALDPVVQADTDRALAATGKDVGTPIIHFDPPDGTAFFGPVISRLPDPDQAVALWDHITGLARYPGFAELKRSLREVPQLRAFGMDDGQVGAQREWNQGRQASAR